MTKYIVPSQNEGSASMKIEKLRAAVVYHSVLPSGRNDASRKSDDEGEHQGQQGQLKRHWDPSSPARSPTDLPLRKYSPKSPWTHPTIATAAHCTEEVLVRAEVVLDLLLRQLLVERGGFGVDEVGDVALGEYCSRKVMSSVTPSTVGTISSARRTKYWRICRAPRGSRRSGRPTLAYRPTGGP